MKRIFPCIWYDGNAKAAADFYCGIFQQSAVLQQSPMAVVFEIAGVKMMGLNGGPMFTINPSISLFVKCDTEAEIDSIWQQLSVESSVMMALNEYPWAKKYGWLKDRFGMTWQLMLGDLPYGDEKITPTFLFVGEQYGKAQVAMKHYTHIFANAQINNTQLYAAGEGQPEGTLKFGMFNLQHTHFITMDGFGNHAYGFNEGVSIVVECDTQQEIDHHWDALTKDGAESRCGWLKDKFGVSWQIIPAQLGSLMTGKNAPKVMQALMGMKKIDVQQLLDCAG
jgi:predicted 3-demethylubiquinone-9 3-methyltransferase (glyoxalase superfamily)